MSVVGCLLLLVVVDAEHIELFVPNSCNMQQKSSVRGETKEEKINMHTNCGSFLRHTTSGTSTGTFAKFSCQ